MTAVELLERSPVKPWRLTFAQASEVPGDDGWLSPGERHALSDLHVEKRRTEWRLGRWAAKRALRQWLTPGVDDLQRIAVLAAADGAPEAYVDGVPCAEALSISHRAGTAMAVVSEGCTVGCDIEVVEPRSDAFVADYFTGDEGRLVHSVPASARALVANLIWSCKESAAKALRVGLSVDTRSLAVSVAPSVRGDRAAVVVRHDGGELRGWWRRQDAYVVTVVFGPPVIPKERRD